MNKVKIKKCKSIMIFGDDFGDNRCTFHCEKPAGHKSVHREAGKMYGRYSYRLTWQKGMKK